MFLYNFRGLSVHYPEELIFEQTSIYHNTTITLRRIDVEVTELFISAIFKVLAKGEEKIVNVIRVGS